MFFVLHSLACVGCHCTRMMILHMVYNNRSSKSVLFFTQMLSRCHETHVILLDSSFLLYIIWLTYRLLLGKRKLSNQVEEANQQGWEWKWDAAHYHLCIDRFVVGTTRSHWNLCTREGRNSNNPGSFPLSCFLEAQIVLTSPTRGWRIDWPKTDTAWFFPPA